MICNLHLFCFVLLGTGCTVSLTNAAHGELVAVDPAEVRLEVVSARVVQVFNPPINGGWFKSINICVRKTLGTSRASFYTVDLLYPHYARPPMTFRDRDGAFVYRASSGDLKPGCDIEKLYNRSLRPVVLEELPVLRTMEATPVALEAPYDEAIYVAYAQDSIKALGFVSVKPFFTSKYNFNIDILNTGLYSERTRQKPYLLLLAPLTATIDVVGGAIMFGVMGVSCNSHPDGCR